MTARPRRHGPSEGVEVLEDLRSLFAFAPALADLCEATGAPFYMRPAFFMVWSEHAARAGLMPRCLVLKRGATVLGFAPLFSKRLAPALLGARRLSPPLIGTSPPFDLVVAPNEAGAVARLADAASSLAWVSQHMPSVLSGSGFDREWAEWFEASGAAVSRLDTPGYMTAVCTVSKEEYFESRRASFRRNVKRASQKFEKVGEIETFRGGDPLEPWIDALRTVVERSWKGTAYMRRTGFPLIVDLVRSLDASGLLVLRIARREGRPIGYLMEVDDGTVRHAFHNAMDESERDLGPGILLLFRGVLSAIESGRRSYEFWGNREYIRAMATDVRPAVQIDIASPAMRDRWRRGLVRGVRRYLRPPPSGTSRS